MTLVSRYKFEGDATDSTGSNHLTMNGSPTFTLGKDGFAIDLGSPNTTKYVQASSSTPLDITTGDFSIAGWIYRASDSGTFETIARKRDTASTNAGYSFGMNTTNKITGEISDGNTVVNFPSSTSIALNTWYHVAAVWDRDGNGTIYINGVVDGTPGAITGHQGSLTNTQRFSIGRFSSSSSGFLPGRIDDLRFYNHALTAAEVAALVSPTLKSAQTNLAITTDPASTILTEFQADWGATPAKTIIFWGRSFNYLGKTYGVVVKDFLSDSPAQILGADRYRYTRTYKVHVWSKGVSLDDALDKKFAIESEIERIVKTDVDALAGSGFDEWDITPFRKIETGTDSAVSSGIAGDKTILVRSVADLRLMYDIYV